MAFRFLLFGLLDFFGGSVLFLEMVANKVYFRLGYSFFLFMSNVDLLGLAAHSAKTTQ